MMDLKTHFSMDPLGKSQEVEKHPSSVSLKKCRPRRGCSEGFSFKSIIIHSSWITLVGLILFRLATANTQKLIYVKIFSIAGVVLATGPWIIQLIVSTTIIIFYNAKLCDLTWLVRPPVLKGSQTRPLSNAVAQDTVGDCRDEEAGFAYQADAHREVGATKPHKEDDQESILISSSEDQLQQSEIVSEIHVSR